MLSLSSPRDDDEAVKLAICYHDAIYDASSATNEDASAELLLSEIEDVPAKTAAAATAMIRMTKSHALDRSAPASAADAALFLDLDLAILGAPPTKYDEYAGNIRAEYAHVPDALYRVGRARILAAFLERKALFLTDELRDRHEMRARENLAREIAALTAGVSA